MKLHPLKPVGAVAALTIVPVALASGGFVTILMGKTEVKGGTTKIGEIDPAVIPTAGPDATGEFCNAIPGGKVLGDLDISIKKGSAGSVSVDGGAAVPFSASGVAHVPITMTGGVCKGYTVSDLEGDGSGENLVLNVTPSDVKSAGGSAVESNILPAYRFDRMSDLARNGAEIHHAAALALVHNDDGSRRLTSITGTVSFPGAASAELTDVHLFEADDDPVGNAVISVSDGDFSITGFGGVSAGDYVQVLLVLDADLGGEPMRARVQGAFAP